jgi:hypothetical protein
LKAQLKKSKLGLKKIPNKFLIGEVKSPGVGTNSLYFIPGAHLDFNNVPEMTKYKTPHVM